MRNRSLLPVLAGVLSCLALPARGQNAALPDGPGRDLVQQTCVSCHALEEVTRAGYDREGWQRTVATMVNRGAKLTPAQATTVAEYLARNFPDRGETTAVIIPGPAQVTVREWRVPTAGSHPHDPLAAPDGSIWYTGINANLLGRLDPATGQFREHKLTTPDSGPHGLVFHDGAVWFTANYKGYIGKLDPATGRVVEYKMPDPAARDPHTLLFDKNGTLWFTVQGGNMIGRLNPQSGEIKLVTMPTPRALPYGIVVSSQGTPYFDEFGTNRLASVDPATLAIREYVLPNASSRPRRIAIAPDDTIYYTDYAGGHLGRLDPKTGNVTEWPSPGGRGAQPYAITFLKGAVWYSESGVRPNTLVRFDPQTQKFQTWAIPSGGGVVRNMMPTRDGNLVLACSGVDRVALVEVK